jgi:transposase
MAKSEQLTDEQWAILEPLIAEPLRRDDGRGQTVARKPRSAGWNSLDIKNRRALAGFTRQISAIPDLPPTFPNVG